MAKSKLLGVSLLLLTLVAGLALYYHHNELHNGRMTLHGNVDIRQVDLGFRVGGRLDQMAFEEGAFVKSGEQLAQLDKLPFEYALANQKALLEVALANLTKFQTGSRPQEIQEAVALLKEKEVNFENAQKTLKRQADLVKKNWASKQTYDDAYARAKEAEAQVKTATEALKLAQEGFRKEDIRAALAQVEAAKAQLATATTNLEDTTLLAPTDGIIMTRIREPGTILGVGEPVYTLALTNPVWIRAYASEITLGRLKPGMEVAVYTDTDPQSPYKGHIGFISPQAEFTPKNVETKELRTALVYRLRITVEDPQLRLRQGMPVTVVIQAPAHD